MGKSDVLVRFKAETQNYDANVAKAKKQLDDFGQANFSVGGAMKQTTSMLVASASKFVGWGAAVSGALKVAKDAFLASETNIDDWEGTIASAKGVYEGFVQSLNNGDISGFLNNISQIVQAAREAYNALDELGTRQTILNPERARLQARATELKATIRREGASSEAGKAAQAELKSLEKSLTDAWKTESKLNRDAFTALVREKLAQGGITLDKKSFDFLMKTFSSDAAFQRMRNNARGSIEYKTGQYMGMTQTGQVMYAGGGTVDTRNINQKLLDLFTDEWRQQNSGYLTAAYGARGSAASVLMSDAKYLKSGTGGGGGSKGGKSGSGWSFIPMEAVSGISIGRSMADVKKDLAGAQSEYENAGDTMGRLAALAMVERFQKEMDAMKSEENPFADAYAYDFQKDIDKLPEVEDKKEKKNGIGEVQVIASEIQNITGALESMGFEIPEGLSNVIKGIQGVSTILTSIAAICTVIQTLSAIQTARGMVPFFHRGGIVRAARGYRVPGNYGFDAVPSLLTSGEIVMNRAQQGNIASQLSESRFDIGGSSASSYVRGEDVFLGVNNFLKRSGRGEIVTSRR